MRTIPQGLFTLSQGETALTYTLTHSDGRETHIKTDWQFPSIAALMGWSPCSLHCTHKCHGETDGTVDCAAKTTLDHILDAITFLESNIGQRVTDVNGVFDYIEEDGYES